MFSKHFNYNVMTDSLASFSSNFPPLPKYALRLKKKKSLISRHTLSDNIGRLVHIFHFSAKPNSVSNEWVFEYSCSMVAQTEQRKMTAFCYKLIFFCFLKANYSGIWFFFARYGKDVVILYFIECGPTLLPTTKMGVVFHQDLLPAS